MKRLLLLLFAFSLNSCTTLQELFYQSNEVEIATVNNNVCKRLRDKVVIYAVFVDSKATNPWTEYDMESTIDSIHEAMEWIECQAQETGIPLNIQLDYHRTKKGIIPIKKKLRNKALSNTLFTPGGVRAVDQWADKIGKVALGTFGPDSSKKTYTKVKPYDRERLIARLRDKHQTDNVALMYFINNYYSDEVSVAMHTHSDHEPEYAIVSFKKPAVIVHEFLHLFGALDLYITPFEIGNRRAMRKKAFAMKEFPNEVMAFPHRGMDSLRIGDLTKYLVGWDRELDDHYVGMLASKKIKVAKY